MKSYRSYIVMACDEEGWSAAMDADSGQMATFQATVDAQHFIGRVHEVHPDADMAVFSCVIVVNDEPLVGAIPKGEN